MCVGLGNAKVNDENLKCYQWTVRAYLWVAFVLAPRHFAWRGGSSFVGRRSLSSLSLVKGSHCRNPVDQRPGSLGRRKTNVNINVIQDTRQKGHLLVIKPRAISKSLSQAPSQYVIGLLRMKLAKGITDGSRFKLGMLAYGVKTPRLTRGVMGFAAMFTRWRHLGPKSKVICRIRPCGKSHMQVGTMRTGYGLSNKERVCDLEVDGHGK